MAATFAGAVALLLLPAAGSLRPALQPHARCPRVPVRVGPRGPRCQDVAEKPALAAREVALAFGAAMSAAWGKGEMRLSETMRADCQVVTPIWKCADRAAYEKELAESRAFFAELSPPALIVLTARELGDGRAQLVWMLGVEWGAVWRPRINILGESTLTIEPPSAGAASARVSSVVESWHASPLSVFTSQVNRTERHFLRHTAPHHKNASSSSPPRPNHVAGAAQVPRCRVAMGHAHRRARPPPCRWRRQRL